MLSWAKSTNSGYNYQNKTFFSLSQTEVVLVLELLDRSCRSRTRPT
ncbi:hypothetical protein PF005_g32307 [Phytophthora fragariae]|uniref:Uncharacterized protein n=1 Tax=Phytophthora fragariae TaxID=53985 RepID=A0A6A3V288_9STRA|nr:hypothetical protein PF005_g32307 [Phytophthora fragariae]